MLLRLLSFDPLLVLLGLLMVSSAAAAPVHAFPAAKREGAAWWKDAAPLKLPASGGRLAVGWDAGSLYVHIADAPEAGTLALQVVSGAKRISWTTGAAQAAGFKAVAARSVGALDVSMKWSDLGLPAGVGGRSLPFSVGFQPDGGSMRWLPGTPLPPNPVAWGALYLNDGAPLSSCARTLTRPLLFDFHATGSTPHLTISPEPTAGLCLPVEVTFSSVGDATTVLRTERANHGGRFAIPAVEGGAYPEVSFHILDYGDNVPEVEYRALPHGQALEDFGGSPGWREPADWQAYWDRARAELAAIPPDARVEEIPERASKTGRLYKVTLTSLQNVKFAAWYFVPKDVDVPAGTAPRRYPAVQMMPGYGAEEPPIDWTARGLITFSVNPRGHGPSGAYWPLPPNHLMYHLDDPAEYYYRGAFMDCLRAVQWLMGRPEVDAGRVAVEGCSQGGVLSLATAALEPRVAACSAGVPFLCDFPSGVRLASRGGMAQLRSRFEAQTPDGENVRKTLGYVDATFMAAHVRCPTLIGVGQMDRTCPPEGGVAAYHHLPPASRHRLMIVPGRDHEVMPEWRAATNTWYRTVLKTGG
jgi:cephalosporin-C deacetylase